MLGWFLFIFLSRDERKHNLKGNMAAKQKRRMRKERRDDEKRKVYPRGKRVLDLRGKALAAKLNPREVVTLFDMTMFNGCLPTRIRGH